MVEPSRLALPRAHFVQFIEFDKYDPTIAYVQAVEKDYWYQAWRSENYAYDRAIMHKEFDGDLNKLQKLGALPVKYSDLMLGQLAYAYLDGKVVRVAVTDIKSRGLIICTTLKTRKRVTTSEFNLFDLFGDEKVGRHDDMAVRVRLSRLSLISGFEEIPDMFAASNFKDHSVWELKMLGPDHPSARYPCVDLVSMSGVSLSIGMLKTMRDGGMCRVKIDLNKIYVAGFTHVDGKFVWFRTDDDWVFDRIRLGMGTVQKIIEKHPETLRRTKGGAFKKLYKNPLHIFLARYADGYLYRVAVIGYATEKNDEDVVVEMSDYGLRFVARMSELIDPSEYELPLAYIPPRCLKGKVIDQEGRDVVGDDLYKFAGRDYDSLGNPVQNLDIYELREVLVLSKETIENTEVFKLKIMCGSPENQFGVFVPGCARSKRNAKPDIVNQE